MKVNILDLIDFKKVDTLLEGFNKSTGFVTAVLDLKGNVISKSGWRGICTEFHRINPETSKKCAISDTELANKMGAGEKYHFYKCLNGLVDVAVPIVINGEHIANLFSGQFFFDEPDRMFFKEQAAKYGFNEKKYLEALNKVPVVTKEKVLIAMDFLLNMTQLISEMTVQKLEQIELNTSIKESEEKFKSVFESANVGKSITSPTGEIYVNKTFCSMLGYTREELQNKKWQDITPEEEIPIVQKKLDPILNGKKDSVRFEKRYICKNGNHIWFDVSVSIRRDEKNNPLYFITTVIDINERKKAEKAQHESEEKYRLISDNSDDWIYWIMPDGQIHYVSPACERITGYSPMDFTEHWELNQQIVFDADKEIFNQHTQFLKLESSSHELEYRIITKSGELRWISHSCNPIFGNNGEYMGRRGTNRNITERKLVEEQLQHSEHRFSSMFNLGPVAKSLVNISEMVIIDFNKAAELMFEIKRGDVVGKLKGDLDFWVVPEERLVVVELLRKQGFVHGFEFQYKTATGKTGWASSYCETIEIKGEKYSYNEYIDITEQKRTEEVLRENNSRLEFAMQSAKMAWWEMDIPTGHVIFSKQKADMLGYPPEKFSHYTDFMTLVHPDDYEATMKAMRNHLNGLLPKYEIEYRILTNSGNYKWLFDIGTIAKRNSKGTPLKISGLVLDIDIRKQAEEKIREKDILFRKLSANVPDLIYQFTRRPDGSYCVPIASEGIKNIFGCTPEEVLDGFAPISQVIYHEDMDRVIRDIEYSAEHLTYFTCEFRVLIPGREIQWIFSKSTPEKLPDGSITWYGFNVDITQKKLAEEKLNDTYNLLRIAGEKAKLGGWNVNLLENNSYWSEQVAAIHEMPVGYSPPVEEGIRFYAPEWREKISEVFTRCAQEGVPYDEEMEIITSTGKKLWVRTIGEAVRDKEGNIFKVQGAFQDISERKKVDEAIRKAHDQLAKIVETSPGIVCTSKLSPDGKICFPYGGKRLAEYFGIPEAHLEEDWTPYFNLIHPDDIKDLQASIEVSAKNLTPWHYEWRMNHPEKGVMWIEGHSMPLRDPDGNTFWHGVATDITEQKQSEIKLVESEKRYRTLFENMTAGFVLFEVVINDLSLPVDLIIVAANEKFEATTGLKIKQVIGKRLTQVLPGIENDKADWIGIYGKVALSGEPKDFEQGSELLGVYYSIRAYQSGLMQCAVTFDDVTEKKQVERALAESEDRFHKAFMEAPMGIAMAGFENKRFIDVNHSLCEMLGYTEEEMKMLTFEDITHPDDRANDTKAVKDVFEGRIFKHITEKRYLKKNGDIIWGIRALTKISNTGDKPDYALALIKDITDRKKAEEELSRLNTDLELRVKLRTSELENVNKELETFTYSVSHDLKAPLRGIDGYSKLLSDIYKADLNEEAQRFIDTIRNSTLQMNHLIDDLLDYSRLERSHLSIGRIKIKDLIHSLLSIYNAEMETRSIKVKMEISDIEIIADLKGLTIAIRNLIENAIKFTKGSANPFIQINLEENSLSWIISIRDNGIGFDMQYHKKIFEIFQRLQRVEDFPGTGIGLAMVSKAMQRMHGKVWAQSAPGMGSTFYLEVIKNQ